MSLNAYIAFFTSPYTDITPDIPTTEEQDASKMAIIGQHATGSFTNWTKVHSFDHLIKENNHGNFTFVKDIDAASPDIAYHASAGTPIATVKFVIAKTGDDNTAKMTYRFADVKLIIARAHNASVQQSAAPSTGTAGAMPTQVVNSEREFISFQYQSVYWDAFDVSGSHCRGASWNVESNIGSAPSAPSTTQGSTP